jgi:hypothetical protein
MALCDLLSSLSNGLKPVVTKQRSRLRFFLQFYKLDAFALVMLLFRNNSCIFNVWKYGSRY